MTLLHKRTIGHGGGEPTMTTPADARRTLTEELAELERTDPAVKKAAENYARTVNRLAATPPVAAKSRRLRGDG